MNLLAVLPLLVAAACAAPLYPALPYAASPFQYNFALPVQHHYTAPASTFAFAAPVASYHTKVHHYNTAPAYHFTPYHFAAAPVAPLVAPVVQQTATKIVEIKPEPIPAVEPVAPAPVPVVVQKHEFVAPVQVIPQVQQVLVQQPARVIVQKVEVPVPVPAAPECDKDSDCGNGYYCALSYCEPCIPCQLHFHRHPPIWSNGEISCARLEEDCGSCLPGYQAHDLTNQRHSMECFPLVQQETTFTFASFSWTGILWIAAIFFVMIALIVCFLKCRQRLPVVKKEEEHELMTAPTAPPPYNFLYPDTLDETDHLIGSVRESQMVMVQVEQDHCNRAVPIGYDDEFNAQLEEPADSETDDPVPVDESIDGTTNESTETIPSFWEPTPSITNLSTVNLVRSQSLELPRIRHASANQLVRLSSDPALSQRRKISIGGENYSHRHVRLSQYRLESQNAPATEKETEEEVPSHSCSVVDGDSEPKTPEPFAMVDDNSTWSNNNPQAHRFLVTFQSETTSGSRDSGFQDQQSRRRQRTTEELVEINFALMKRRRRNDSGDSEVNNDCSLSDDNE